MTILHCIDCRIADKRYENLRCVCKCHNPAEENLRITKADTPQYCKDCIEYEDKDGAMCSMLWIENMEHGDKDQSCAVFLRITKAICKYETVISKIKSLYLEAVEKKDNDEHSYAAWVTMWTVNKMIEEADK